MSASATTTAENSRLQLESAIGFGGHVPGGLQLHPDGRHLLYTLGSCVVIREIGNPRATEFLTGHSDKVSCLAVSRTGRYIASGQITHMGFQADICVFDWATRKLVHRMLLHKVKVQALSFSADELFLASIGGQDDNTLVVWDLATGRPLCGGPAANDISLCLAFLNNSSNTIISGGHGVLRVWEVDVENRKVFPTDVNVGNVRREFRTIVVEATDRYAYVGTTSGDVVCVQLQGPKIYKMVGPVKKFSGGVICCALNAEGDILVGSGGGDVALLSKVDLHTMKSLVVDGGVTSVASLGEHYFVGTSKSNVYYVNAHTFKEELRQTCHYECINDVIFPAGYSELFATCSKADIRIWNARTCAELLRIQVGVLECNNIAFTKDGRMIVSAWSDGKIRAFGPQTGRLVYVINDAHKLDGLKRVSGHHTGVTAICVDNQNKRICSGGADGQVRVWATSPTSQQLLASLKEHKGTVNSIAICGSDTECISASDDGSCIVWDLARFVRRNIIYSQTYFKSVVYLQDESQLLTVGSDRKITYWDATDCSTIREIEGSKTAEIHSVDISPNGELFVTGGGDRILKLWSYDEGQCLKLGLGHSGGITRAKFSPDGTRLVSVGDEGTIMVWKL